MPFPACVVEILRVTLLMASINIRQQGILAFCFFSGFPVAHRIPVAPAGVPEGMVQKHLQDGYSTARTYVPPSNAIHCHANIDAGDRAFCTLAKG